MNKEKKYKEALEEIIENTNNKLKNGYHQDVKLFHVFESPWTGIKELVPVNYEILFKPFKDIAEKALNEDVC